MKTRLLPSLVLAAAALFVPLTALAADNDANEPTPSSSQVEPGLHGSGSACTKDCNCVDYSFREARMKTPEGGIRVAMVETTKGRWVAGEMDELKKIIAERLPEGLEAAYFYGRRNDEPSVTYRSNFYAKRGLYDGSAKSSGIGHGSLNLFTFAQ